MLAGVHIYVLVLSLSKIFLFTDKYLSALPSSRPLSLSLVSPCVSPNRFTILSNCCLTNTLAYFLLPSTKRKTKDTVTTYTHVHTDPPSLYLTLSHQHTWFVHIDSASTHSPALLTPTLLLYPPAALHQEAENRRLAMRSRPGTTVEDNEKRVGTGCLDVTENTAQRYGVSAMECDRDREVEQAHKVEEGWFHLG